MGGEAAAEMELGAEPTNKTNASTNGDASSSSLASSFCRGKGLGVLVWFNLAMCLFHAALVAATLVVGNLELSVPVYQLQYSLDVQTSLEMESRGWKLIPAGGTVVMELKLTWMTAAFFAISSAFHLGNAVVWKSWYLEGIKQCRCPSRWIEYTFSASLMSVLIAYGAGTNILQLLVAVFFLSATTMFFGHLTECLARPCEDYSSWTTSWPHRLQAHFMGYVPQITAWFIIMYSFHQVALSQATITTSAGEVKTVQMPNFVYGIVYGELVVFWSFGIIQLVFTLLSPKMYPYGELCYQIMSLVSKGLLGLILIVNVLMLSRFEDIYNN